ncbi:hypothetical protein [Microcoleus sp. bin38.metabat.b11b12b14.051]|uniref:hypothetical protein n=1 Tax=Microcoleus sp. bin38.metabat.b11b12b14.051 TaxID=2742709 RepID=UPI0025FF97BD|nr:hypothetical protein [Microcoleus sp. bin38.metabat.b11b12b14.051]
MRFNVLNMLSFVPRTVRSPYKTSHDVHQADRPLADPASVYCELRAIEAWAHLLRLKKLNIF